MTQINRRHQLNCGGPRSASVALRSLTQFTATALLISASACGGGNSTPPAYTIGGTVAGLATGAQLTLANSGGNALTVTANGAFTFTTPVAFNGSYAVTIGTQPTGQTCAVSGGTGTAVAANVTNVSISCSTNTYTIGGTVAGLATGAQLTLVNSGSNTLTVTANGAFTFTTPVAFNGSYAVTVRTQPTGQTCAVSGGTGTGVAANVTNVGVSCATNTYTIGGTVSGLTTGAQLTLVNSGSNALTVTANGAFTFSTPVVFNGSYAVIVGTQPTGQICTVSGGSGTSVAANVTNVSVSCAITIGYAYTANNSDSTLSQYAIVTGGSLMPLTPSTVMSGGLSYPKSVAVDPSGHYAYVTNAGLGPSGSGGSTVSEYAINAGGVLVPLSISTVATALNPSSIAIDPTDRFAYVVNTGEIAIGGSGGNAISQYAIGAGGELVPMNPATVATGHLPNSIAIDPTGQYAYVANTFGSDSTISQYMIGTSGALTPMSTPTVATGATPYIVIVDPTGRYVYCVNFSGNSVSQYTIGAGGALTQMATATVAAGLRPASIAVDPTGHYAYVTNTGDFTVSQYMIGAGGALAPLNPATVTTGESSISLTIDATGHFVFLADDNDNTVSQYMIGVGGALAPLSPTTVTTGIGPEGITTTH